MGGHVGEEDGEIVFQAVEFYEKLGESGKHVWCFFERFGVMDCFLQNFDALFCAKF